MNLLSFTAFILFLILFVGFYLLTAEEVSGGAKIGLIVFLIFISIYLLLNLSMFRSYYEVIDVPIDAKSGAIYEAKNFSRVDQVYTLSTWIYIDDWNENFGQEKGVLRFQRKGAQDTSIRLDQYENNLIIRYDVYTNSASNGQVTQTIKIPNINIQKWVCITVAFNTNNTDTYINGKLIDTDVHPYPIFNPSNNKDNSTLGNLYLGATTTSTPTTTTVVPASSSSTTLSITEAQCKAREENAIAAAGGTTTGKPTVTAMNGFSGKIGLTRYYGRVVSPKDAWDIYTAGPTTNLMGSFLNRYNATFTFLQDNKEVQKISIM
jgi:hypothetical protein